MVVESIPFRIRVGVVAEPGAAVPTDPQGFGEDLTAVLEEDVRLLLDDKSAKLLEDAEATGLGHTIVTLADDELAARILDAASLPDRFRRRRIASAIDRSGRGPERLIDECDVLLLLTAEAPSVGALEPTGDALLHYAARHRRPVIGMWTRDGSTTPAPKLRIEARSIARIDLYNTWDGAASDPGVDRDLLESSDVPDRNREIVANYLKPHYERASSIAGHFQGVYFKTARRVYTLSVAAVALVALGALLHPVGFIAFSLELAILISILVMIRRAHRNRSHEKWLESRYLAERLRHAMHLVACGVLPVNHRIPPHVGGLDPPDYWMVMAFEEICHRLPELTVCDETTCSKLSGVARKVWVDGQIEYHERTRENLERKNTRLEWAGLGMFSAALVAAALHLAMLLAHELHLEWPEPPWLEGSLIWLALVLPSAGASIGGFRAHREFSRLSKRSAAMVAALKDMKLRLASVSEPEELEGMLHEVERWMVEETQGWLMLMSEVQLDAG